MALSQDAFRTANRVYEEKRRPQDNIFFGVPFYDKIKIKYVGGGAIAQAVTYSANSDGGSFDPEGTLSTPRITEEWTQARYDWVGTEKPWALSEIKIAQNEYSKTKLFDLVMAKRELAEASIVENDIAPDLFSDGTDLQKVQGLDKITLAADTTNPLGGISTTDAPAWAGFTDDSANSINEAFLQTAYRQNVWAKRSPDLMITTKANLTKYLNGLLTIKRTHDGGGNYVGGMEPTGTSQTGVYYQYGTARLFEDINCPANNLYVLQTEGELKQHGKSERVPWIWIAALKGRYMVMRDYPKQVNSEINSFRIVCYWALVTRERRSQQGYGAVT